jgi:phospholipid transport system substrate-binding protein
MKSIKKALKIVAIAVLAMNPAVGFGQELTATETAEIGVEALLKTVENAKGYFLTDKDLYFSEIEGVLNTFVDFEAVAEVVMNRHASAASEVQKQRFANILKTTLTRFYGASLISYSGEQLIFLPPSSPESDPRADTIVGMELRGSDMNLRLQYQMFINENNEWKLKNLSLAGINLGRQYFTQFSALMSEYDEDINLVLDNWQ